MNRREPHCGWFCRGPPAQPHLPRELKVKGALLRGWPHAPADMAQEANAGPPDSSPGSLNLGRQKSEAGGDRGPPTAVGRSALLRATLTGEQKRREREFWGARTLKTYTSDSRNLS